MGPGLVTDAEKRRADQRRWDLKRRTDPEARAKLLAKKKRYRQRKADLIRAYNAAYAAKNAGKMRQWRANWEEQNAHALPKRRRERRLAEARATPSWADKTAIADAYSRCARVTRCTGIPFHVDHIVPLRGNNVCGLHVHWNLRVIPAYQNYLKSNRCE
jgi:hypothetical protein